MTTQFYVGNKELPYEEYQQIKTKEIEAGHGIVSSEEVDGYPEYTLQDGTVIRGDKEGGFNRVEDGEIKEAWVPGTENQWSQGEPMDIGKADFFCKAD